MRGAVSSEPAGRAVSRERRGLRGGGGAERAAGAPGGEGRGPRAGGERSPPRGCCAGVRVVWVWLAHCARGTARSTADLLHRKSPCGQQESSMRVAGCGWRCGQWVQRAAGGSGQHVRWMKRETRNLAPLLRCLEVRGAACNMVQSVSVACIRYKKQCTMRKMPPRVACASARCCWWPLAPAHAHAFTCVLDHTLASSRTSFCA